jgi:Probable lipoprotein LpqN
VAGAGAGPNLREISLMKHWTAATIAVALGLALVGCGSSNKTSPSTSTSASTSTSTSTSTKTSATSATPGAKAGPTIADYISDNHITETPIHHGDPGPNVDLPVPNGWQLNQNSGTSYGGIVLTQPANPADPPSISALFSKLTGDVDPAKIIEYAPNELLGLPGYQGTGNGQASTLGGFQAWQLNGTYQKDGKTRAVAQKTVVIPSQGALYVLQLNADSLQTDQGPLMDATNIIDDQTTITTP